MEIADRISILSIGGSGSVERLDDLDAVDVLDHRAAHLVRRVDCALKVLGIHGGRLKVALAAPPVDGKANAVLLKAFAKHLGVSKSAVAIASGESSREKRLEVTGLTEAELLAAFRDLDTD